jgi:uncharacterized protein
MGVGRATVPFVAGYRKEATGAPDDAQLRILEERLRYLRELDERRTAILDSISKARLEDLYLPYRPKRRTKAARGEERGGSSTPPPLLARSICTRNGSSGSALNFGPSSSQG